MEILEPRILEVSKIVKPRKPYTKFHRVIVFDNIANRCWNELYDWQSKEQTVDFLATTEFDYIIIGRNISGKFLHECINQFRTNDVLFQTKISNHHGREPMAHYLSTYRYPKDFKQRRPMAKHYFIDPDLYTDSLAPLETTTELIEWATTLRDWLYKNNLRPCGSLGGIATQLLTDSRFYDQPRRKVPKATNDRLRPLLPGNIYDTTARHDQVYPELLEIDYSNAHHRVAATVPMPDSDNFFAKGFFAIPEHKLKWKENLDGLEREYGVIAYCNNQGDLSYSTLHHCNPTNIKYIISAWSSRNLDTALPKYAEWAIEQIGSITTDHKWWLKPTLHALYGVLATKAKQYIFAYEHSSKGTEMPVHIGGGELCSMQECVSPFIEPKITHVAQRIILETEANNRIRELADRLEAAGHTIVSIYGDAIYLKRSYGPLIDLPEDWKCNAIHKVNFPVANHIVSIETTKMPGVPRYSRLPTTYSPRAANKVLKLWRLRYPGKQTTNASDSSKPVQQTFH